MTEVCSFSYCFHIIYIKFALLTFSNDYFVPNHCLPHSDIKCLGVMMMMMQKHAYNRNIIKVATKFTIENMA